MRENTDQKNSEYGHFSCSDSIKIFIKDAKNAEDLNTFFSNAVKNIKIPDPEEVNHFAEKLSQPILKAIFKYSKPPSIISINNVTNVCT